jgi:hypothetical protein
VQPLCTVVWRFLKKLKIELTYNTMIPFLVYLREYKPVYNTDTGIPLFIAALIAIDKLWKQPR